MIEEEAGGATAPGARPGVAPAPFSDQTHGQTPDIGIGNADAKLAARAAEQALLSSGTSQVASESDAALDAALDAKRAAWTVEQQALVSQLSRDGFDSETWTHVGGVDISFVKGTDEACASLVVLDRATLATVYSDFARVRMDEPYMAGFLAFREVKHLQRLHARLVERAAQDTSVALPDVILVDGNGVLHPHGFGLASHLGVMLGVPTVGVAKNFMHVDGLTKDGVRAKLAATERAEDGFTSCELVGVDSGRVWGAAVLPKAGLSKPIFVSQGHGISLAAALAVVKATVKFRIPEPVRQADLLSRKWLRERPNPPIPGKPRT